MDMGTDRTPSQLADAGHHFDDVSATLRRQIAREGARDGMDTILPQERLRSIVERKDLHRPAPNQIRRHN
jgi:hypothetical protein